MKKMLSLTKPCLLLVLVLPLFACTDQRTNGTSGVVLEDNQEGRIDVMIDGEPFTSYLYTDTLAVLKKPVFYPVRSATGRPVTRGFPLDPVPGERADHPHQIGAWLNHGDVNNLDFWNNSDTVSAATAHHYGTIRHQAVRRIEQGDEVGTLAVLSHWLTPEGRVLLEEETLFTFSGNEELRIIDRTTTLTARDDTVRFEDSKEGMMAIRVARPLELVTAAAHQFVLPDGRVSARKVEDNTGATGNYLNSEGIEGLAVWGKRARWTMLSGTLDGETTILALFDHPENEGHPTYWMARGYGLFAANPLGDGVYSEGRETRNFTLQPGSATTFRYRLLILSGSQPSRAAMETYYQKYVNTPNPDA